MDVTRIGVIGAGGIFRNLHAPFYESSDQTRIVAVTDADPQRAEEAAESFGAVALPDAAALLAREDVDAVDICTHPRPHRDLAVAAAEAGKHILVEKPMCCTVAEANDMIDAAEANGVMLQVAYMMRFNPHYEKLKSMLDDATIGKPVQVYCHQVSWFAPRHPWLFIQEESGGMLVEQAIHVIDLWLWLLGPVESVFATTAKVDVGGTYPPFDQAVDNVANVIVRFHSGATGVLVKSWAAQMSTRAEGLIATNGSAITSQGALEWTTHDMDEPQSFVAPIPDDGSYATLHPPRRQKRYWAVASKGRGIQHWLHAIAGDEHPTTHGRVGRAGIAVAEAAYRSAATGNPVAVEVS